MADNFISNNSNYSENELIGPVVSDLSELENIAVDSPSIQLSPDAIKVGFENHKNNIKYDTILQQEDWNVEWTNDMDQYTIISDEESYSGDKSLKMLYPNDTQINATASWKVPSETEYYLSYWLKFDENFDFNGSKSSGGKLPGLGADELCSGGVTCDGTNGFSSRYMWRENGKATIYLYHMDKPGAYGEDILLKDSLGNDKYFERGQWHNLIQRVKINEGNLSNGELEVWMDQEQVLDMDNLKFATEDNAVNRLVFSSFHGGNGSDWWPENDVNAYFDDFVVSPNAEDVGCLLYTSPSPRD